MAKRNNSQHIRSLSGNMNFLLSLVLFLGQRATASVLLPATKATTHPVFTYKNASTTLGQLVTSSTLVWETYNPKDSKQLQYAVEGGRYITEDEHYAIYVCRVAIDGIPTSGHTEKIKQTHKCVAAHYRHGKYDHFDVLVNRGHLGKVSWKPWRVFNAGIPIGSISIGEDGYIGRHRVAHHPTHTPDGTLVAETHWGADYHFGRLEPHMGLGKITVLENENEKSYDDGEVLVETEPFRYELRDIKLDHIRMDKRENLTELAFAVLANRADNFYSRVGTVLSYSFDHIQNWGTHEGTARGLPTKIYEKDVSTPTEINWGLKYSERRYETTNVQTQLFPGTAINVTLRGNYVTLEAPYTAKLFAYYYGNDDSVSRKITADVRKSYLKDIKLEYSPVYWIENGTLIPTTTTSTTSTTARITTSTSEASPMHEPPVVHVNHIGHAHAGADSSEKSLQDSPAAISNEIGSEVPENFAEKHQKPILAGVGVANENSLSTATELKLFSCGSTMNIILMLIWIALRN